MFHDMAVAAARTQPNWTPVGDSGVVPRQCFPPPSTQHQMTDFLEEDWCGIPPIEFQTLVESMPRCVEGRLAACGGPIKTICLCFLYLAATCMSICINAQTHTCTHTHNDMTNLHILLSLQTRYSRFNSVVYSSQAESFSHTERAEPERTLIRVTEE
jgi:hypothetical protein